jgi:RHS repeat-associated protein
MAVPPSSSYAGSQLVGGERMKWGWLTDRIGGVRHYHLDHLGSVRLVTDAQARLVAENDYYPYGATPTKSFQEQLNFSLFTDSARYAGHHRDFLTGAGMETDEYLDYMHARYYDPGMGRFLSVDPGKDWDPKQPQSWNMYAYVRNNPVRFTDPTGKYVCRGDAAAGGCDTIERGLDRMREAAAGLKNSDPRKAALQAVIKAYGKQGDDTSKISTVWINPRNANGTPVLPSNVNGQAGKNGTMFVSLVNIAAKAGGNADKAFTMLGGTLTHEGKHMLQPAVAAFSGRASLLSLIFYERQAYSLQQGYYAGLGQAQAAPDPDKGALASANEACTRVPCDP